MSNGTSEGCVIKVITLSGWSLIPLRNLGRQCGVSASKAVYTGARELGCLYTRSH